MQPTNLNSNTGIIKVNSLKTNNTSSRTWEKAVWPWVGINLKSELSLGSLHSSKEGLSILQLSRLIQ